MWGLDMPMKVPKAEHRQAVEEVSGHGNRDVILFPREAREQLMRGSNSCAGEDERSGSLFSYVDLEAPIDQNHPLRMIRMMVNEALARSGDLYCTRGWDGRFGIGIWTKEGASRKWIGNVAFSDGASCSLLWLWRPLKPN
jgi:hypothetical protein